MRAREFIINVPIRIRVGNDPAPDTQSDSDEPELENMVPPLQQQIELDKRQAGITNVYDEQKSDPKVVK